MEVRASRREGIGVRIRRHASEKEYHSSISVNLSACLSKGIRKLALSQNAAHLEISAITIHSIFAIMLPC
jgi:hypothetical protein